MTTIFKYPLERIDEQLVVVPRGARFLSAGLDPAGQLCVWAYVDPDAPPVMRTINVFGTGNPAFMDDHSQFLGTVREGPFIWHVFARL